MRTIFMGGRGHASSVVQPDQQILPPHVTEVTIEKDLSQGFDYRKITVEGDINADLGIESSSLVASVAIVEDDITMARFTADFKKTHSQTLASYASTTW